MARNREWYEIDSIDQIDSPALIVYKDRIKENLENMISLAGSPERLMPHVKTHKMEDIVKLHLSAGITQFKCATIAEAEMIAATGGKRILIAFQPVGPKIRRIINLIRSFPESEFSVIVDNLTTTSSLNVEMVEAGIKLGVYLDVNTGMNRTGILPDERAKEVIRWIFSSEGLHFMGIHAYDGHNLSEDFTKRREQVTREYKPVYELLEFAEAKADKQLELVSGGTPTFPVHAVEERTICSPGTTVLWDASSQEKYAGMPFKYAALVIARVISRVGENRLCLDLGHKAIAAETPLPRVKFLNHPEAIPVGQSEEHIVVEVPDGHKYDYGEVFYGVPWHICPTCALYQEAVVVENNKFSGKWQITARNRFISI